MIKKRQIHRSAAQWQEIFRDHQKSSQSVASYCREHHLNTKSFYARRRQLNKRKNMPNYKFIEMIPPKIEDFKESKTRIISPQGYIIEISNDDLLFAKQMFKMIKELL